MKFVDYKCLESLLIDGEEMIATEGITGDKVTLKFFGKEWNPRIHYDMGDKSEEAKKIANIAISKLISKSESISKTIESNFCKQANTINNEVKLIDTQIKKYTDIPKISVTGISVQAKEYKEPNKGVYVVIQGEWTLDPEHGYSIGFDNNRFIGDIRQYMSDY